MHITEQNTTLLFESVDYSDAMDEIYQLRRDTSDNINQIIATVAKKYNIDPSELSSLYTLPDQGVVESGRSAKDGKPILVGWKYLKDGSYNLTHYAVGYHRETGIRMFAATLRMAAEAIGAALPEIVSDHRSSQFGIEVMPENKVVIWQLSRDNNTYQIYGATATTKINVPQSTFIDYCGSMIDKGSEAPKEATERPTGATGAAKTPTDTPTDMSLADQVIRRIVTDDQYAIKLARETIDLIIRWAKKNPGKAGPIESIAPIDKLYDIVSKDDASALKLSRMAKNLLGLWIAKDPIKSKYLGLLD